MLKFYNGYTDRTVTVVSRNMRGQDGDSVTVEPYQEGAIEIDSENQAVFSTTAVTGVVTMQNPTAATIVTEGPEIPEEEPAPGAATEAGSGDDTVPAAADETTAGGVESLSGEASEGGPAADTMAGDASEVGAGEETMAGDGEDAV